MNRQRNSRQRALVLAAVMSRRDHPSADEIYLAVRAKDEKISRGTVYRNLSQLDERSEVRHVKLPAGPDRYDWRKEAHYHILCTGCGAVIDAPAPYRTELDAELAAETGYQIDCHRTVFEGLCPACLAKRGGS